MKKFNAYDTAKAITESEKLPVGGYILTITDAQERTFKNGGTGLEVFFDISEGEYKDFYKHQYKNRVDETQGWKGKIMLFCAVDDGSDKDARTASRFKSNIDAVEQSNPGFHWDWDESKLKGKRIGGVFREEEWEFDGRNGVTVKCAWFKSVSDIKAGKFKVPAKKALNGGQQVQGTTRQDDFDEVISDDDLPFTMN